MKLSARFWLRVQAALRNAQCRLCETPLPLGGEGCAFCQTCRETADMRPPTPLTPGLAFPRNTQAYAATTFSAQTRRWLYPYKFYGRRDRGPLLAELLIDYWRGLPFVGSLEPDCVWVTATPTRTVGRAHLTPLVERFAEAFGYRAMTDLLVWKRWTERQHALSGRFQRLANVCDSMACDGARLIPRRRAHPAFRLWGLNRCSGDPRMVVVLDDLLTTGATLNEACRAIREGLGETGYEGPMVALALAWVPAAPEGSVQTPAIDAADACSLGVLRHD